MPNYLEKNLAHVSIFSTNLIVKGSYIANYLEKINITTLKDLFNYNFQSSDFQQISSKNKYGAQELNGIINLLKYKYLIY